MRYMLDTNICIYLMQRRPPEVVERFRRLARGDLAISAITLAELRVGIERRPGLGSAAAQALQMLLTHIPAVPFDTDAAVSYGILAAAVPGRRRDALDRLIAAHAVSLGLILVTNNQADFDDYPGLVSPRTPPPIRGGSCGPCWSGGGSSRRGRGARDGAGGRLLAAIRYAMALHECRTPRQTH